jgi:hypothetical protein
MTVASPVGPPALPSILGSTIRRSFVLGRIGLIGALAYAAILSTVFDLESGPSAVEGIAILLPIFAVVGSMGGLIVFTGDRVKGVYEYLIAYGISPRRLFVNVLVASLVLVTTVLGVSLAFGLGLYLARGDSISVLQVEELGLYSVPMSYASAALAATVGMFWTSLSSPRQGMSSSIGLIPFIALAPSLVTLAAAGVVGASYGAGYILPVTTSAIGVVTVVVLVLMSQVPRLLTVERFLSPV